MLQEIANVVDGMIQQMHDYVILESTVNQYYRGYCKPMIRYCIEKNGGYYSKILLQEYLSELNKKCQKGIVQERYFRSIRRCVNLLISYAETGITDFSIQCDTRKYKPIESNSKLIDAILDETDYKERFKYKLDCCMRQFFCFIESLGLDIAELSDGVCLEFLHMASKTNQGSMDYIIMELRLITDYFRKHELADIKADFSMFRMKYAPQRLIEPYTKDEIYRILNAVDISTELGKRDKAILLLAFDTGLRAIDISKLRLQDIDWKDAEVHIIQSKTKGPLSLPLHASVMNAIADYILEVRKNSQKEEVFLNSFSPYNPLSGANAMDGIIEKYCRLAKIEKKPYRSFHSLRRSFATELSLAEVPLPIVSQMLGHKSIDSDRPYLMYNESQTILCTTGFELIPVISGTYSDAYIPPIRSRSTVKMECLKIELLKLSIMNFCDIPMKEGVYVWS